MNTAFLVVFKRLGEAQVPNGTGYRLVPAQASWGQSGADLNRSVPVPFGPVPTSTDRCQPVPTGAGAADSSQETLYIYTLRYKYKYNKVYSPPAQGLFPLCREKVTLDEIAIASVFRYEVISIDEVVATTSSPRNDNSLQYSPAQLVTI